MTEAPKIRSAIYSIRNTGTGQVYIGSASDYKNRWLRHLSDLRLNRHTNARLQNSFNKYGETSFEFAVVEPVKNKADLLAREQFHMDLVGACGPDGFNILRKAGSPAGMKLSAATKERIRLAGIGRIFSAETRAKISSAQKGKVIPEPAKLHLRNINLGKTHSEETKARISQSQKGRIISPETKARRVATHVLHGPYARSPETIAKMRIASMGVKHSAESIKKREATRKANDAAKRAAGIPKPPKTAAEIAKRKATMAAKKAAKAASTLSLF